MEHSYLVCKKFKLQFLSYVWGKGRKKNKLKHFFPSFCNVWASRTNGRFFFTIEWQSHLSVSVLSHLAVVITELLPYLKYRQPVWTGCILWYFLYSFFSSGITHTCTYHPFCWRPFVIYLRSTTFLCSPHIQLCLYSFVILYSNNFAVLLSLTMHLHLSITTLNPGRTPVWMWFKPAWLTRIQPTTI